MVMSTRSYPKSQSQLGGLHRAWICQEGLEGGIKDIQITVIEMKEWKSVRKPGLFEDRKLLLLVADEW